MDSTLGGVDAAHAASEFDLSHKTGEIGLPIYRVAVVVRDNVLLTLFLQFHNIAQLLGHFAAAREESADSGNNQIEVNKT